MPIILSQKIDVDSTYSDIPFVLYHFPKKYRNQIKSGDIFIYYQGDRHKKERRYYFGYGVIGQIDHSDNGEEFYAKILNGNPFPHKVPIYYPTGGYYESLGFNEVRKKLVPGWQSSIRKISDEAYYTILKAANIENDDFLRTTSNLESLSLHKNPLDILTMLNEKYKDFEPQKRNKMICTHLDRGRGVTEALKKLLGAKCQICNWEGFSKKNGDRYIEAHHLAQLSFSEVNSLCTDNIILLCPNCHRKIHHGKDLIVLDLGERILIETEGTKSYIFKNSLEYLREIIK